MLRKSQRSNEHTKQGIQLLISIKHSNTSDKWNVGIVQQKYHAFGSKTREYSFLKRKLL
jgi:hypothetical protein